MNEKKKTFFEIKSIPLIRKLILLIARANIFMNLAFIVSAVFLAFIKGGLYIMALGYISAIGLAWSIFPAFIVIILLNINEKNDLRKSWLNWKREISELLFSLLAIGGYVLVIWIIGFFLYEF